MVEIVLKAEPRPFVLFRQSQPRTFPAAPGAEPIALQMPRTYTGPLEGLGSSIIQFFEKGEIFLWIRVNFLRTEAVTSSRGTS
jgi:hypothetical protein